MALKIMETTEKESIVKVDFKGNTHARLSKVKRYLAYKENTGFTFDETLNWLMDQVAIHDPQFSQAMKG